MKTQLLALMLVSHLGYAYAKEDLATTLDIAEPAPKSHSIDFIDKGLKLSLSCSVGETQPILNVTMGESFAFGSDPSVLIIRSDKQHSVKFRGTATLMNFTSLPKADDDLWQALAQLQTQELSLEAVSFRSSKYTSSTLVAVGFSEAVSQLKQQCSQ
ncbi:hypothetical protein [Shewanella mangrovisoli]|uniref:Uncharacterized protein n=1 Tax=Shewanella mangrovisoli TaxID=2864211 RepID=A0ABV4VI71_9GAMM